ncbi:MAG: M18 family aminopeptidase [Myxococcales bacterium]|nr:M18 family aminopeptidase [Myxococcales bacterium]MCB9627490.1 M18 family aminopeptidase [Sandaracinaceae bacterium]
MIKLDAADDLLAFIDRAPSPYHAVREVRARLDAAGFRAVDERDALALEPDQKFYVVRAGTTLAAFHTGTRPPAEAGFSLIGAHTDSPNLRIKPTPDTDAGGCRQLSVEPYGGVLYHTWLDRDLSLAGSVAVAGANGVELRMVDFARPLLRVPSLAIHLHRGVNTDGLILNAQKHLPPVWALASTPASLRDALAAELSSGGEVAPEQILSWDLGCYELTPATRSGLHREFLHAGRLDNLASCHASISALVAGSGMPCDRTRGVVLFDHEEVGSRSAQGAAGTFLSTWLDRITMALSGANPSREHTARAMRHSFLVSADMAHAAHPNYLDRHDSSHRPELGAGLVIKTNNNQSYTTNAESAALFSALCKEADAPVQHFVTRSDLGCGSTIGPVTAAQLGIQAIDVGNPMLSMHSAREMAAADDVAPMIRALTRFLQR